MCWLQSALTFVWSVWPYGCDLSVTTLSVVSQIRNGSTADSPLMDRLCGSTLPSPIFPQSNLLYLRFKSDFSHARDGFEVTWTSSPHGQNFLCKLFLTRFHETSSLKYRNPILCRNNCEILFVRTPCIHKLCFWRPVPRSAKLGLRGTAARETSYIFLWNSKQQKPKCPDF